jgi:hypothetical protein
MSSLSIVERFWTSWGENSTSVLSVRSLSLLVRNKLFHFFLGLNGPLNRLGQACHSRLS